MSIPLVELADCCDIISGATPSTTVRSYWNGDIHWATPKDLSELDSHYIAQTAKRITAEGLASCAASVLPPHSVLFSSRAPIGHVAVNTVPMATNQGFKSLIPKKGRADAKYLFHWLKANRNYLESLGNGATFKELSKSTISRVQVPLPDLATQHRIATILDLADTIRSKRREALAQLDRLAQAIFIEMFGDPLTNPKRWPEVMLGELGTVVTGNTPSREDPANFGHAIEWIKSDNLNTPHYYVTRAAEGLSEVGRRKARMVPESAILVTCIAGSPDCIGNCAMTDREVAFNQQINAFVPRRGNPHYYLALLKTGKKLIQKASTNGMKGMVSKGRFEQIRVMFPPEPLQEAFAERALTVVAMADNFWRSQQHMNTLFAALQQRAFSGSL